MRGCERRRGVAPLLERLTEFRVERGEVRGLRGPLHGPVVHRVEEHRRPHEQVVREHQHAGQQNQRLEGDLHVGAHEERLAPRIYRLRGEVALDLALVAAEIRQHQEQPADEPGPERVGVVRIEAEVDRREASRCAGDVQRLAQRHVRWKPDDESGDRRTDGGDDHDHLLHVGPRDCLHAAEHRVDRCRQANRQHGQRQAPTHHDRENHRRRRDDHAALQATRQQEQQARQRARFRVKSPLEIFVRGVDARAIEERHRGDREDDHRERQAEVELHEPEAVAVALPRRADKRDRAELRGHHRQAYGPPRIAPIPQDEAVDLVAVLRPAEPVPDDEGEIAADDEPIEPAHAVRPRTSARRARARSAPASRREGCGGPCGERRDPSLSSAQRAAARSRRRFSADARASRRAVSHA